MIVEFIPKNCNVATLNFRLFRLEKWRIAFGREEFYPPYRVHLFKGWFWRTCKKD